MIASVPAPATTRILVVCTASRCRSPLAAAQLRSELERRDVDVVVGSAGFLETGHPATDATIEVAAATLGLDLTEHRSRTLNASLVLEADLLVAMERRHVRDALALDPTALERAFTLKELTRLGEAIGPRGDESLTAWLGRVHESRERWAVFGSSAEDDVVDPTENPAVDHATTAQELGDLVVRLAQLAWPVPPPDADS